MPYALYWQVWGWIRYSKIQGLKQSHQGLVCLSPSLTASLPPSHSPSLFFFCPLFYVTFMIRQPLYSWWQDGCQQPSACILPEKNPLEKPSFLVFPAKLQNLVSDSAWGACASMKQLWQPSRWNTLIDQAESCSHPWCWGWGKPSELRVEGEQVSKIKSRCGSQTMDAGQTETREWSPVICYHVEEPWKHEAKWKRLQRVWFSL